MNVLQNRLQHKAPEVCTCIQGVQEVVEGEVTATVAQSEFAKASIYCEVFGSHGERNSERLEAGKSLWSKLKVHKLIAPWIPSLLPVER